MVQHQITTNSGAYFPTLGKGKARQDQIGVAQSLQKTVDQTIVSAVGLGRPYFQARLAEQLPTSILRAHGFAISGNLPHTPDWPTIFVARSPTLPSALHVSPMMHVARCRGAQQPAMHPEAWMQTPTLILVASDEAHNGTAARRQSGCTANSPP